MEEKIHIVHQVVVGHQMQTDVAKEHRVSSSVVCCLVRKAQKNKAFLQELVHAQEVKESQEQLIKSTVTEMNDRHEIIDSVAYVCKAISKKQD